VLIPPIGAINPAVASDPAFQLSGLGADASLGAPAAGASGGGFGSILVDQISNLNAIQNQASTQSQALATGQATDVTSVVADIEKAALAMQLATQVRNSAVNSYNELFRMQM
jgi:flagellar hook-basal body complex protein FliE